MRWAARSDPGQAEIVRALRKAGYSVLVLSRLGQGAPDLLVGHGGRHNILMEVKDESGDLNAEQRDFHAAWRGRIVTVRSVRDAIEAVEEPKW